MSFIKTFINHIFVIKILLNVIESRSESFSSEFVVIFLSIIVLEVVTCHDLIVLLI